MALAGALHKHGGSLRASLLAEYGIRLVRGESIVFLGDLFGNLPLGCAVWRAIGGPLAWSEESHRLNLIEYRLRVIAWQQSKDGRENRNHPKPPESPPYADEGSREHAHAQRQAAAHKRRAMRAAT